MVEEAIRKAGVLIEALPYIQAFRDKVVVIKYGGSVMTDAAKGRRLLEDVVFMHAVRMQPVLVHGGGPVITERMRDAGLQAEFIEGMRVTDDAAIRIVEEALGDINGRLVESLGELGASAQGVIQPASDVLRVNPYRSPPGRDLGFVGQISSVDTQRLRAMIDGHAIPVIAPLGMGEDGSVYNINADDAAADIAAALHAEKLVLLTDVEGILRTPGEGASLISTLQVEEAEALIERDVIQHGMIPKVRACFRALDVGVHKAHIVDGGLAHSLLLEIFTDAGVGTQIVAEAELPVESQP